MPRRSLAIVVSFAVPLTFALELIAAPFVSAGDPCYHGFQMPALTVSTDTHPYTASGLWVRLAIESLLAAWDGRLATRDRSHVRSDPGDSLTAVVIETGSKRT